MSAAFEKIAVYAYGVTWGQYDRMQLRQCQAVDVDRALPGSGHPAHVHRSERRRCGADTLVIVERTSRLTGNRYEDAMCEYHARPWAEAPGAVVELGALRIRETPNHLAGEPRSRDASP